MTSLYEILDVPRDAAPDAIHAAYRKRALETHPDAAGGSATAFTALKQAHDVLMDAEMRARYDATGEVGSKAPDAGRGPLLAFISQVLETLFAEAEQKGLAANIASLDMIGAMKELMGRQIEAHQQTIAALERRQKMWTAMRDRFKTKRKKDAGSENVFAMIVDGRVAQIASDIEAGKRQIAFVEEALKLVDEYRFTADAKRTQSVYAVFQQLGGSASSSTTGFF